MGLPLAAIPTFASMQPPFPSVSIAQDPAAGPDADARPVAPSGPAGKTHDRGWEVAFRCSPLPGFITDAATGECLSCNEEMEAFLHLPRERIVGNTAVQLQIWSRSVEQRLIARQLRRHGSVRHLELRSSGRRGADRFILVNMEAVELNGRACHLVQLVDITARKQLEQDFRLTAAAVEHSGDALVILNTRGSIVSVNPAFSRITGLTASRVLRRSFELLLVRPTGRHEAGVFQSITGNLREKGHWEGEIWVRHRKGHNVPILLSLSPILDDAGMTSHFVCVFSDITRQKDYERQLQRMALYDSLTGLANRTLFTEKAKHALDQAARTSQVVAVMYVDLDHFKQVNDEHGHAVGDALLVQVAQRLNACVRATDTVGRFGGDEFVVLVACAQDEAQVAEVAQRLLGQMCKPFKVDKLTLTIGASIGVACHPAHGSTLDVLLEVADDSLYDVKAGGRKGYRLAGSAAPGQQSAP